VLEIEYLRAPRRPAWCRRGRACGSTSTPTWAPAPQSAAAAGLRTERNAFVRGLYREQGRRHGICPVV